MYVVGSVGSFGAENDIFISVNRISDAVVLIIGWEYADRKPLSSQRLYDLQLFAVKP